MDEKYGTMEKRVKNHSILKQASERAQSLEGLFENMEHELLEQELLGQAAQSNSVEEFAAWEEFNAQKKKFSVLEQELLEQAAQSNSVEEFAAWEEFNAQKKKFSVWEQRCNQIIKGFHSMDVVVENFGLRLTRKDLYTLVDSNWLNDEVINFYMNLLIARGTSSNKYPKVHAMNTFFFPKLLSSGHSSLKRWTRKVDIFAQDIVIIPIHLNVHWCIAIVDFRDKSIVYYDSMGGDNPKCLAALQQYVQDESLDKKKHSYDMSDWKFHSAKNIPRQMNGSDCGVFSCMFAEYVCANKKITFTQDDMSYFREKMFNEIINGAIL